MNIDSQDIKNYCKTMLHKIRSIVSKTFPNKRLFYYALIFTAVLVFVLLISLTIDTKSDMDGEAIVKSGKDKSGTVNTVVALFPLTGPLSHYGEISTIIAELAVEDVNTWLENQERPWRLELLIEDTGSDESMALDKMAAASVNGNRFFIGPLLNSSVLECLPYANEHQLLMVSPTATSPVLAVADDWLFRFCADESAQGQALAKVANKIGLEHLIIGWQDDLYGESILRTLRETSLPAGHQLKIYPQIIKYSATSDFSAEAAMLDGYLADLVNGGVKLDTVGFCNITSPDQFKLITYGDQFPRFKEIVWLYSSKEPQIFEDPALTQELSDSAEEYKIIVLRDYYPSSSSYIVHKIKNAMTESQKRELNTGPVGNNLYNIYDIIRALALAIDKVDYHSSTVKDVLPEVVAGLNQDDLIIYGFDLNEFGDKDYTSYEVLLLRNEGHWMPMAGYIMGPGLLRTGPYFYWNQGINWFKKFYDPDYTQMNEEVSMVGEEEIDKISERSRYFEIPFVQFEYNNNFSYLGMSKEELIDKVGLPDRISEHWMGGGEEYFYSGMRITYIFASAEVANNLWLEPRCNIAPGVQIGMTYDEIFKKIGENGIFYDWYLDSHVGYPYYATYLFPIATFEGEEILLELWLFSDDGVTTDLGSILWKSYWDSTAETR